MTVGSEVRVPVKSMKEPQCVERLTKALHRLDPAALVNVNLDEGMVDVITTLPEAAVVMAVKEEGFKLPKQPG